MSAWKSFAVVIGAFLFFSLIATGIATVVFANFEQDYVSLMSVQAMSSVLMFAVPALVSIKIIGNWQRLTQSKTTVRICLMAILGILCSEYLIEWSGFINEYLSRLPEFSAFANNDFQETNARLLSQMINFDDYYHWTISIVVIALLPAICEELFFRATLQSSIERITHNSTTAIIVTAIIFSAMHVDFAAFIPRFILGCILGTIFRVSGSIIPGMLAHMANNTASLIFIHGNVEEGRTIYETLLLPCEDPGLLKTLISLTLVFFMLTSLYRIRNIGNVAKQDHEHL